MTTTVNFNLVVTFPTPTTATFTYYQNGNQVEGDITVTCEENVVYTLQDSPGVTFVAPTVTNDPHANLSHTISDDGQVLTIHDSDQNEETICVVLNVKNPANGATVPSPDPQYRNIPR